LAFLIHHTVQFSPIDVSFIPSDSTECQAIRATINGSDLSIFNVYLPPVSSCPRNFCPDLSSIVNFVDENFLVCGDLNAHHAGWDSSLSKSRGERIAESIEASPLIILNQDTPTRLPNHGSPSSPDVSVASAHLALACTWSTHLKLNSDHLPITITFPSDDIPSPRKAKSYTNFSKADWPFFICETEAKFRS
jgi:endonuclease/exonuclease/phosphatase family metal-dependent hydrolase